MRELASRPTLTAVVVAIAIAVTGLLLVGFEWSAKAALVGVSAVVGGLLAWLILRQSGS